MVELIPKKPGTTEGVQVLGGEGNAISVSETPEWFTENLNSGFITVSQKGDGYWVMIADRDEFASVGDWIVWDDHGLSVWAEGDLDAYYDKKDA